MKGALAQGMKSWIWLADWDKVDYHFIPDASGSGNIGFLAGGAWVKDDQRGTGAGTERPARPRRDHQQRRTSTPAAAYPKRTIAFWFRARREARRRRRAAAQVLYEEGGPGSGLNLYLDGDVLYAGAWNQGKGTWLHGKDLERDVWHHAALVAACRGEGIEAASNCIWTDKRSATARRRCSAPIPATSTSADAGTRCFHDRQAAGQPGIHFAGRIDDFRIVNRALKVEEVVGPGSGRGRNCRKSRERQRPEEGELHRSFLRPLTLSARWFPTLTAPPPCPAVRRRKRIPAPAATDRAAASATRSAAASLPAWPPTVPLPHAPAAPTGPAA